MGYRDWEVGPSLAPAGMQAGTPADPHLEMTFLGAQDGVTPESISPRRAPQVSVPSSEAGREAGATLTHSPLLPLPSSDMA